MDIEEIMACSAAWVVEDQHAFFTKLSDGIRCELSDRSLDDRTPDPLHGIHLDDSAAVRLNRKVPRHDRAVGDRSRRQLAVERYSEPDEAERHAREDREAGRPVAGMLRRFFGFRFSRSGNHDQERDRE